MGADVGESTLTLDLDPIALRNTIKLVYGIDYLTFSRIKELLKQGAKFNGILRIKDDSFNDLVDALKLPYECKGGRKKSEIELPPVQELA